MATQFPEPTPRGPKAPRLISIAKAAHRLGLSRRTIYRMVDRGELPLPVKVGSSTRFFEEDLDHFLDGLRQQRTGL